MILRSLNKIGSIIHKSFDNIYDNPSSKYEPENNYIQPLTDSSTVQLIESGYGELFTIISNVASDILYSPIIFSEVDDNKSISKSSGLIDQPNEIEPSNDILDIYKIYKDNLNDINDAILNHMYYGYACLLISKEKSGEIRFTSLHPLLLQLQKDTVIFQSQEGGRQEYKLIDSKNYINRVLWFGSSPRSNYYSLPEYYRFSNRILAVISDYENRLDDTSNRNIPRGLLIINHPPDSQNLFNGDDVPDIILHKNSFKEEFTDTINSSGIGLAILDHEVPLGSVGNGIDPKYIEFKQIDLRDIQSLQLDLVKKLSFAYSYPDILTLESITNSGLLYTRVLKNYRISLIKRAKYYQKYFDALFSSIYGSKVHLDFDIPDLGDNVALQTSNIFNLKSGSILTTYEARILLQESYPKLLSLQDESIANELDQKLEQDSGRRMANAPNTDTINSNEKDPVQTLNTKHSDNGKGNDNNNLASSLVRKS